MTIKDYKQFIEDNSEKIPEAGCWIWMKYVDPYGYGMATRKSTSKTGLAHREVYREYFGDIPTGFVVMHRCDNPSCVNPEHLKLGTQKDNMKDMKTKGRSPDRKGENGTTAKLSKEDVVFIKSFPVLRGSGKYLANLFKVSKTTICDIRKGRSWK